MPRVSDKQQLITQFFEMLARENEEQAQAKMFEQFEQFLEHLNETGIASIEALWGVIKEVQAIGNGSDSSISSSEESSSESNGSGNDSEMDSEEDDMEDHIDENDMEEDDIEEDDMETDDMETDDMEGDLEGDLELEIRQNQLVMVYWILTHRYLHGRQNLPKSKDFSLIIIPGLDQRRFQQLLQKSCQSNITCPRPLDPSCR